MKPFRLLSVTLLTLLTISLPGAVSGQPDNEENTSKKQEQATENPASNSPAPAVERFFLQHSAPPRYGANPETDAAKRREKESEEREKADLIAQQGMNAATQEINLATQDMRDYAYGSTVTAVASAGIAFLSLVLMLGSIILLWRANKAAFGAVSAGRDAVTATREIGKAQAQAYVHVEKAELLWGSDSSPEPRFILTVINTGMTPARWFECEATAFTRELDGERKLSGKMLFSDIDYTAVNKTRWNALGAGKETTLPAGRDKSPEIIDAYRNDNKAINIAGVLRYETFFGDIFESEFWFVVGPQHRYRRETTSSPGIITYREIPAVMRKAAGNMETFRWVEKHN